MRTRLAAVSTAALLCLAAPALADECTDRIDANRTWMGENPDVAASLDPTAQRDLRDLDRAAMILQRNDQGEACEDVVDAMRAIAEQSRERAATTQVDESARVEMLGASTSLAEVQGVLRADELIGRDLRNLQNEELGEVDDVVVATGGGGYSYAIVAYGGFLGIGEERVAVPLSAMRITEDRETLVLDMSAESFEGAPRFSRDDMAPLADAQWVETNATYFEVDG